MPQAQGGAGLLRTEVRAPWRLQAGNPSLITPHPTSPRGERDQNAGSCCSGIMLLDGGDEAGDGVDLGGDIDG
jgi:hypothetical protein